MNALEFFSPEAGQRRRQWLESKLGGAENALRYYFGPTGVPDKMEGLARALEFTDAGDMVEAGRASRNLWNSPSWEAATDYLVSGAALAVPFLSAKLANEGVDVLGSAVDDFMTGYDPNRVNIFAGVNAKTADLGAYEKARQMAESGASRDDIWRETGWFQGVDGKWRFEIDDSASSYAPDTDRATVSEVFTHDGLFEAYPDLANSPYARTDETNWRGERAFNGSYDDGSVTIHDDLGAKGGRRVMLHELQHGVQDIEGFSPGGNPSQFVADDLIPLIEEADAEQDRLLGLSWRAETPEEAARLRALSEDAGRRKVELRKQAAEYRYDNYQRLAGEVEARNVEARRDLSAIGRSENPPFLSGDVAPENQIVRRGRDASGVKQSVDADGALDPATTRGQEILDLLSAGRASEVTDDMLDMGDPVLNARLNEYLWKNYDLPMDEASRMARAEGMGYNGPAGKLTVRSGANSTEMPGSSPGPASTRNPSDISGVDNAGISVGGVPAGGPDFYHGTTEDVIAFDGGRFGSGAGSWSGEGVYTTPDALEAEEYGNVILPLLSRGQNPNRQILRDYNWSAPDGYSQHLADQGYDATEMWVRDIDDRTGEIADEWLKERVDFDPANIRSRFARFDPRLSHLRNLSAGIGALTLADILAKYGLQQDGPSSEAEIEAYLGGI